MGDTLLAAGLGVAILYMFYRAVETSWPDSYLPLDRGVEYAIIADPLRYTLFRFLPVYLVCLFAAVSLDRSGTGSIAAVAIICVAHLALSNGRALVGIARGRKNARRGPLSFMHIGVSVGILLAGTAAYLTRDQLEGLVPPVEDLSLALWTAALAGVAGAYVIAASKVDRSGMRALKRSRRSIAPHIWRKADQESASAGTDPLLVKALMIVENANRPRWFRWLENQKGRVWRSGSYGIMQVAARRPISDEESITIAVRERLTGVTPHLSDRGYPDPQSIRDIALAYNPDAAFADAVMQSYFELYSERPA